MRCRRKEEFGIRNVNIKQQSLALTILIRHGMPNPIIAVTRPMANLIRNLQSWLLSPRTEDFANSYQKSRKVYHC